MPLSDNRKPEIVTIPLIAATNTVSFTFNFKLPTSPLNRGASQAHILWIQFVYTANGVVGTRVPVFNLFNSAASSQFSIASINTNTAGTVRTHNLMQGVLIFPVSVTGLLRTLPNNGLFAFNNWSINIADLNNISAGDAISGRMQVRLY